MKLGLSQSPVQSDDAVNIHSSMAGVVRLDGRIIDFADVLVSVRVMLVGGFAQPRKPGSSGVEAPAMEAWTSSSSIPVQAYRTVMVARWR